MPDVTLVTAENNFVPRFQQGTHRATDATVTLAKLLPVAPLKARSFCPKSTTGFPWQSVIRLVSPCTLGYSAATSFPITVKAAPMSTPNVIRSAVRPSSSAAGFVSQFCSLSAPGHQTRQPQSTHRCFWLGHRLSRRNMLILSCALF